MSNIDWQTRYASKILAADDAVRTIGGGVRIFIGSGAAEPRQLVDALVRNSNHFADNQIVHILTLGAAPYVAPGLETRFRHTAFFIGSNVREAVHAGRADFMPVFLSDVPRLIRLRRVRVEAALIQVSPPDGHGYASLGVSVDVVKTAVEMADLVIAEVNPQMPRTLGASFLHVDDIDWLVPVDNAIPQIDASPTDEVSQEIGRNVATLIPNGATLQTGIGRIPDAVLKALAHHHDLGVHTEMFSDGVMDLVLQGVITGRKKTLLPGKLVTAFVMGSRRLYDWLHENPAVEMRPTEFTNHPPTIARNDRMVAINSALAVDLTGQVAADTIEGRFFSGIGGQVDFIRGAAMSAGGKPVIALPATAKDGAVSRIKSVFEEGAGVVTSRGDVQYVVTEYGVADLWGKNIRQRALALINIAHPDFRSDLLAAAKERRYVFAEQSVCGGAYPSEQERTERLAGGQDVRVRPARITDDEPLREFFHQLSDESLYRRFLAYTYEHSPEDEIRGLVDQDYDSSMALVVLHEHDGVEDLIAVARYDADPATRMCDVACVVRDDWQRRGVGTLALRRLCDVANQRGYAGISTTVHSSNRGMLMALHNMGRKIQTREEGNGHRVTVFFKTRSSVKRSRMS